ncbi:hypothetical protein XcyCFBP4188_22220 [Xanthomonas hortorum pv. cynarae]|nr:hypothetical protein XcyCFBP4188_22220 [Xanthomonas hortorum pv. cynarae]
MPRKSLHGRTCGVSRDGERARALQPSHRSSALQSTHSSRPIFQDNQDLTTSKCLENGTSNGQLDVDGALSSDIYAWHMCSERSGARLMAAKWVLSAVTRAC